METLAQIINATLEKLYDCGSSVVYDDETTELIGTMEIEACNTVGQFPYIYIVKAFGWYVFLWKFSESDAVTAYHADEYCQECGFVSVLPLYEVAGSRLCSECIAPPASVLQS